MASVRHIQMGKHRLKLSNLEKVLFPTAGVLKAEIVQYYLQMAPVILRHIKHRPLTFIRFPDGIEGESFYQKKRPDHTPQWVQSVKLGTDKKINYIVATNEASLVWLANLACIEFHQAAVQHPDMNHPDHFVFDLDPPEDMSFDIIRAIATSLKIILERHNYTPYLKTSGKKGLHVYVPILNQYDYDTLKVSLSQIANKLVLANPDTTTLNIRKEARKGKCFIDIVRNSRSQTVICPYSLRATSNASVSTPITWSELETLGSSDHFTIHDIQERIQQIGDPWEGFGATAAPLHDQVKINIPEQSLEALHDYIDKRDFHNTPEPVPKQFAHRNDVFVIHRHSASRLHYDLRLAEDGVLRSWALPKGLPGAPGTKHLAVQTEPHPIEYLDFEGTIPKGSYGAGKIWVFAKGRYRITKTKRNGFYFRLESPVVDNEFRMHLMQNKEWLIERVDPASFDAEKTIIPPMLCSSSKKVPAGLNYSYELKWDGIRVMIYLDEDNIIIRSRSGRDITDQFPELVRDRKQIKCTRAILDGEVVVLDDEGRPQFKDVLSRLHKSGNQSIQQLAGVKPVFCYLFDVAYLDGSFVQKVALGKRKQWLKDMIIPDGHYRFSEGIEDGDALFAATRDMGLEGIIAKDLNSNYQSAGRSEAWIKIKHRHTITCKVIGYTRGKGDRTTSFGALHLLDIDGDSPVYLGKVGSGFDDKSLIHIKELIDKASKCEKPITTKIEDEAMTTWLDSDLYCEVEYASRTKNNTLREPVFMRLRPDLKG